MHVHMQLQACPSALSIGYLNSLLFFDKVQKQLPLMRKGPSLVVVVLGACFTVAIAVFDGDGDGASFSFIPIIDAVSLVHTQLLCAHVIVGYFLASP